MGRALHLGLILLLVLTSLSLGAARGQARVAGQVVLCAGGVATVQFVDHAGRPVAQAHLCPDMALSLIAAADGPAPQPPAAVLRLLEVVAPAEQQGAGQGLRPRQARGPPVAVGRTFA